VGVPKLCGGGGLSGGGQIKSTFLLSITDNLEVNILEVNI
jgi:hypothetical protein